MIFFLVGYMGCGKSSTGRALAKRTGFRFLDTDREVEKKCGKTIPEIFASESEDFFRKLERDVLEEIVLTGEHTIVATGGGLPCFQDNMDLLNSAGTTIYLRMSPSTIAGRLKPGQFKRPMLTGLDAEQVLEFITRKLPEREPFYGRASMIIDCNGVSDQYVCGHIENYIQHLLRDEAGN